MDDDYLSTLNFVIEFLEDNDFNFIMSMDCSSEVENLEWFLNSILKDNHSKLNVDLSSVPNYNEDVSVSADNVFEDFNKTLT